MKSRDIKFRAVDTRTKKWYGSVNAPFVWDLEGDWNGGEAPSIAESTVPEGVVLMEWTGVCDKNGVEIYEGDIVHIEDKRRTPVFGTDENKAIVYEGGALRFDGMNLIEMMGWGGYPAAITYEVVGNIYENPELLKP